MRDLPHYMFDWSTNMEARPGTRAGSQREKALAEADDYSVGKIKVNDYF
jgi:hypothetical protein